MIIWLTMWLIFLLPATRRSWILTYRYPPRKNPNWEMWMRGRVSLYTQKKYKIFLVNLNLFPDALYTMYKLKLTLDCPKYIYQRHNIFYKPPSSDHVSSPPPQLKESLWSTPRPAIQISTDSGTPSLSFDVFFLGTILEHSVPKFQAHWLLPEVRKIYNSHSHYSSVKAWN